jgi:uncharacterized Zn finger protein (UPF0148 family)
MERCSFCGFPLYRLPTGDRRCDQCGALLRPKLIPVKEPDFFAISLNLARRINERLTGAEPGGGARSAE